MQGLILGFEGVGYAIGPPIGSLLVSVRVTTASIARLKASELCR